MFSKVACIVFALCFVQGFADDICQYKDYCYCTCLNDPEAAKAKYETSLSKYFAIVKQAQEQQLAKYSSRLQEMASGTVCTNAFYKKSGEEMSLEVMSLCGGSPLYDRFNPDWTKMNTSVDVCNFIFENGPKMCKNMNVNLGVMKTCDINGIVDIFYHTFKKCENFCSAN